MSPTGAAETAPVDTGWYRAVVELAQRLSWLHGPAVLCTDYGMWLFVLLGLIAWRWGRRTGTARMASVLWLPVAAGLAYLVDVSVKVVVAEPRPCRVITLPTVVACDRLTPYSFPSSHATVAAACAVALLMAHRGLGAVGAVLAIALAGSRVYVGAHYPHDVLAGLVLGAGIAAVGAALLRSRGERAVHRLRGTRLRPLFTVEALTDPAAEPGR